MSYDFAIYEVDKPPACTCGREHGMAAIDLGSPTYNVGGIFRRASGDEFKQGKAMPIADALAMFKRMDNALAQVLENTTNPEAEHYRALEPDNGWGSIDSAHRDVQRTLLALQLVWDLGGMEAPEWEPLLIEDPIDPDHDTRPKRFVPVERLRFQA